MTDMECEHLLIADRVIREDNGKFCIIGIFKSINIPQFPAMIAPWHVYAHVNGVPINGIISITITIYNVETTAVIFSQSFDLNEDQRKGDDLDINIQIANAIFQKPGKHAISININGNNLRVSHFNVQAIGSAV